MPVCWCGYCDQSFFRPEGTTIAKQIVCDECIATGNNNGEPDEPGFHDIGKEPADGAGPDLVCWEHQANREPIRLSFSIKVF